VYERDINNLCSVRMLTRYRLSKYTSEVKCGTGDLLLHNSFMGAIARVPSVYVNELQYYLVKGIDQDDLNNTRLKELCQQGFFVPIELDEEDAISRVLRKERESAFHLIILPHENCNFRCTYCYETFERGKMKREYIEGLKNLVEVKTRSYKRLLVSWFGGEPLLAKDIIYELSYNFLNTCDKNGVEYSSNITTNGYFLTPDVTDSLLSRGIRSYQVSVDGPENIHDKNRMLIGGQPTYMIILSNLITLAERTDNFDVTIRINYNDELIRDIDKFFADFKIFSADKRFDLSFHPIGKWGGPNDSELNVCDDDSAWLKGLELSEKAKMYGFISNKLKDSLNSHSFTCYAGKESSIVVRSDGTICKCTVALEDPRNHVGKLTREGNLIIDASLWEKWVNPELTGNNKCKSCSFQPSCQSRSCPLLALDSGEPPCPVTPTQYDSFVKFVAFGKIQD
jgi:uncharacterized protein